MERFRQWRHSDSWQQVIAFWAAVALMFAAILGSFVVVEHQSWGQVLGIVLLRLAILGLAGLWGLAVYGRRSGRSLGRKPPTRQDHPIAEQETRQVDPSDWNDWDKRVRRASRE